MKAWKTKSYFLGPDGQKMEVLGMTYVGLMPETTPLIHGNVLKSPRKNSNLVMQSKKKKKRKDSNVFNCG